MIVSWRPILSTVVFHLTYFIYLIRFYWPFNTEDVEISHAASSAKIKATDPCRVITVFRILCKIGLGRAFNMLQESPRQESNAWPAEHQAAVLSTEPRELIESKVIDSADPYSMQDACRIWTHLNDVAFHEFFLLSG